jgi:hypothetical protein
VLLLLLVTVVVVGNDLRMKGRGTNLSGVYVLLLIRYLVETKKYQQEEEENVMIVK